LDRFFEDLDCNSIIVDNEQATYNGTMHLINNKYKNIGFITINSNRTQMKDRLSGYQKAIINIGIRSNVLQIPNDKILKDEMKQCIEDFLNCRTDLDAVLFANNYLGQIGLEVIREDKKKIP